MGQLASQFQRITEKGRERLVYLAVSAGTVLVDLASFASLMQMGSGVAFSAALSTIVAFLFSFYLHSKLTFEVRPTAAMLLRFFFAVSVNLAISVFMSLAGESIFQCALCGKVAGALVAFMLGWMLARKWVFRL